MDNKERYQDLIQNMLALLAGNINFSIDFIFDMDDLLEEQFPNAEKEIKDAYKQGARSMFTSYISLLENVSNAIQKELRNGLELHKDIDTTTTKHLEWVKHMRSWMYDDAIGTYTHDE